MSETTQLAQLLQRLNSLEEETRTLRARLQTLEQDQPTTTNSATLAHSTTSRRKMLKAGVLAAGLAVTGAAATITNPHSAQAADNSTITVANSFAPSSPSSAPTRLYNSSTTNLSPVLFQVDNTFNSVAALPGDHIAIAGTSSTGTGVYGTGFNGVYGASDNHNGVYGTSNSGYGIYGTTLGGTYAIFGLNQSSIPDTAGVYGAGGYGGIFGLGYNYGVHGTTGNATTGAGIDGYSLNIGGSFTGGVANLRLPPAGTAPLSRTDAHTAGQIIVDSNKDAWICVTDGTPGTWRKLGGSASAGSFHVLSSITRVVDTRPNRGSTANLISSSNNTTSNTAFAAGETRTYSLDFFLTPVPFGATAFSATVTAVNPVLASLETGYFQFWAGSNSPTGAQVTYNVSNVPNTGFLISPIDNNRQFKIYSLKATDVTIDIIGYYL